MKTLFEIGQKIVCVNSGGVSNNGKANPLIEGKTYIVSNPDSQHPLSKNIMIQLVGFPQGLGGYHFSQLRFVPADFDKQADEEIKNALNEYMIIKN